MDIQKLLDAVSASGRLTRGNYHLTLGGLRAALDGLPDDAPVTTDSGAAPGREHSYRGYYDDLSFEPESSATVAAVRAACERASTQEYEGYKGGEYRYDDATPLWLVPYGCCGLAIIGATPRDGGLHLLTKEAD